MNNRNHQTFHPSRRENQREGLLVLGWFVIFFIAAWVQIIPLILTHITKEFLKNHLWFIPIGVILKITGIFLFYFFPELRRHPLNKIWIILMVECSVLIALPWCANYQDYNVAIALGIGIASLLLTIFFALLCKVPGSKTFYLTAVLFRVLGFCFGMSLLIAYLAMKSYPILLAAIALIYSVIFFELILLFKLIFRTGITSENEMNFIDIAAVIVFNSVMVKIFFISPWLESVFVAVEPTV